MNEIAAVILVILIGALVFATAYFLLKMFFENEQIKRTWEYRNQQIKITTPLQLQAYERMILFLERISPNSLIVRLQTPEQTCRQLHLDMLSLIRAEFEHNLAQQLYISKQAWDVIVTAKENTIKIINLAAEQCNSTDNSMELSQKIMAQWILLNPTPTRTAIDFLKDEAKKLFI